MAFAASGLSCCAGRASLDEVREGLAQAKADIAAAQPPGIRPDLKKRCARGRAEACSALGQMWLVGQDGPTDPAMARRFYGKACELGNARGCRGLAFLWESGLGGPRSSLEATALLARACKGGDARACSIKALLGADPKNPPADLAGTSAR